MTDVGGACYRLGGKLVVVENNDYRLNAGAGASSHLTRRWREADSNLWSRGRTATATFEDHQVAVVERTCPDPHQDLLPAGVFG